MDRFGDDLEAVVGAHFYNLSLHLLLYETTALLVVSLTNVTLLGLNLFDGFLNLFFGISSNFGNLLMFFMSFDTGCSWMRSRILDWLLLLFGFLLFLGGRFFFGFFWFGSGLLFLSFLLFLDRFLLWFSGGFIFFFLFFFWLLLLNRLFGLLLS